MKQRFCLPGRALSFCGPKCLILCGILLLLAGSPRVMSQPSAAPSSEKVRADLNRILSSSEFRPVTPTENAVTRAIRWVGEQWDKLMKRLSDFFKNLFGVSGKLRPASGLQWVFIAIFLAAGAAALAKLLRNVSWRRNPKQKAATITFDSENAPEYITDPDIWRKQAADYAEQADYRRAFRALFVSALLSLDRAGAIEFVRSRTNGDYLRTLRGRAHDTLAAFFEPFIREYEYRWFGEYPTDEADYRRALALHEQIGSLLTIPPSKAIRESNLAPMAKEG